MIFKNDKEKAEARKSLSELVKHPGWEFIIRAIDENVEYFTDQLRSRVESKRDFESLYELYALQDRIDDIKEFKNLPKSIAQESLDDPEELDDSIYE